MRSIWPGLMVGLTLMIPSALPAATAAMVDKACVKEMYGVEDHGELARFDTELRQALKEKNLLQLSTLVNYPLRVNGAARGTILINDPQALKNHFDLVFTPELRKQYLSSKPEEISCMGDGLMIEGGLLWARVEKLGGKAITYRLISINVPEPAGQGSDRFEFVCETAQHRIVIDTVSDDLRYRAWNKPRALTAAPDLALTGGENDYQGRGLCGHSYWNFANGTTRYTVKEASLCGADENDGLRGTLEIAAPGKNIQTLECR